MEEEAENGLQTGLVLSITAGIGIMAACGVLAFVLVMLSSIIPLS